MPQFYPFQLWNALISGVNLKVFATRLWIGYGYPQRFAWSTALSAGCLGFVGDLVNITNKKEMEIVHNLSFKDQNRASVWIGCQHQTGGYVWNNGESFNSSVSVQWLGNMSGSVYENKYAEILKNDQKLSKCCKEKEYFICERSKGELLLWGTELDIENDGKASIVPGATKAQVKFDHSSWH